jgi:diaminopimelate epimerase
MNISKYCASGNDFVIFHTFINKDYSTLAKNLCHRQNGIGADGLVVLVPHNTNDFEWLFYNNDGSVANMCGNASRAVAHYAYNNNLTNSNKISFLTGAGVINATVSNNIVESQLTKPIIIKDEFEEFGLKWYIVDTGVPHAVTITDDLDSFDKDICSKIRYKYDVNVNYTKVEDSILKVRTYERGVEDETLACGTGMAACFYRCMNLSLIPNNTKVYPISKEELSLRFENEDIFFKGKVIKTFDTNINLLDYE